MDKNNKFKNFIKKESFYVILFVCLCVVATVAAITAKKGIKPSTQAPIANNSSVELNDSDKAPAAQMDNAEQVKNTEKSNATNTTKDKAQSVANTSKVTFISPINNGLISKDYSGNKPILSQKDSTTKRTLHGINIEAKIGTDVVAAADGKVIEAGDALDLDLGYCVKIQHSDQSVAVYANLDPALKVKVGDVVKQKQVIGKVGYTAKNYDKDVFGEFLVFQVYNSKGDEVDPKTYLTTLKVKK